jgi:hypothetical protein
MHNFCGHVLASFAFLRLELSSLPLKLFGFAVEAVQLVLDSTNDQQIACFDQLSNNFLP